MNRSAWLRLVLAAALTALASGCGSAPPKPDEAKQLSEALDYIDAWGRAKEDRRLAAEAGMAPEAKFEKPGSLLEYWLLNERLRTCNPQQLELAQKLLAEAAPRFKAPEKKVLVKALVKKTEEAFGIGGTWEYLPTPFGGAELYYTFQQVDRKGNRSPVRAICGITFLTHGVVMAVPAWIVSEDEYRQRIANWYDAGRAVDPNWKP
ncbi:MAG: hypothetical protein KIS92_11425 [Planctomycetota bacterium]|nr:hypothetical protein [Planctomycetota bacterium]